MTEPYDITEDDDYVDGMTEDELEAFKAHKFGSPSGSIDGHWHARPEPISEHEKAKLVEVAEAAKVKLDAEGEPPEGFASWFPGPPKPANELSSAPETTIDEDLAKLSFHVQIFRFHLRDDLYSIRWTLEKLAKKILRRR